MNKPKISVIMGIYQSKNKEIVIKAIQSIIDQTFKEWEFIICDDGSSDDTWDFLNKNYAENERFILIRNKINGGLRVALNLCLSKASAEYVVRMDADDYSRSDRLEILYKLASENPNVDVIGTAMVSFDEKGENGVIYPKKFEPQKMDFIHGSVVAHATTIMKKDSLEKVKGYRVAWETIRCEDTDLYMRMYAKGAIFRNIDEPLYYVRQDKESVARRNYINRVKEATVKYKGFKQMRMPLYSYIFVIKPLVVGLVPPTLLFAARKHIQK